MSGRERDDGRGGRERGSSRDDPRGGRGREDTGRSSSRGSSYRYQERSPDTYKKRGEQGGGNFDKYISDAVKMFKPADGDNSIRIMPPTWDGAEHFGLDIFVHYGVGPDSQTYLCLHKMQNKPCPVCDERERAVKDSDQDYSDKLKPTKRVLVYLIDRNNEKDGPIAWSMPWTIDRDLCKLVVDKRSGEILPIDNPDKGYDIEFERKGKGDRTQYIGLAVARRDSDLGDMKWMEFVIEHPLDAILQFYEYDHIAKVFGGQSAKKNRDDVDNQDEELRKKEQEGRGRSTSRGREEPELDWDSIHSMSYEELGDLIEDKKLKINPKDSASDDELALWICEDLGIKEAQARRERTTTKDDDSVASKMDKMRSRRQVE